jgi:hypothetical protein
MMKSSAWILMALVAAAVMVGTPAVTEERIEVKVEKHVSSSNGSTAELEHEIQVGLGDAQAVALDVSDLELGESISETTDSGRVVSVTRAESGYRIDVDGREIEVIADGGEPGAVFVHASAPGAFAWHAADGADSGATEVIVRRAGMSPDEVVIMGLGDLDEDARERVVDALRSAGVSKEIRIIPAGDSHAGNVEVFVTSEGDGKEKTRVIRRVETKGEER